MGIETLRSFLDPRLARVGFVNLVPICIPYYVQYGPYTCSQAPVMDQCAMNASSLKCVNVALSHRLYIWGSRRGRMAD